MVGNLGAGRALHRGVRPVVLWCTGFAVLGLALSIPMLRRLHRRFGTWKAPTLALGVFTLMFSLSAFVIGPAISGDEPDPGPVPVQTPGPSDHGSHHE